MPEPENMVAMTAYDALVAELQEHAADDSSGLGWEVRVDSDLLTHIRAASRERFDSITEAWEAALALLQRVRAVGYTPVYRIELGVDSLGWQTDAGTPDGWRGTLDLRARPE